MMTYNFYDTSSLLMRVSDLFEKEENIVISSITLKELEDIKSDGRKDSDTKYAARKLLHLLDTHQGAYDVHIFKYEMLNAITEKDLEVNNDTKILATAIDYDKNIHPDETIFITNDLALKHIANLYFGEDSIASVQEEQDTYDGFIDVVMDEEEMADFYSRPDFNHYNLYTNQYINVYNTDKELVDTLCWGGEGYRHLSYETFNSMYFGPVKPLKGDIY